MGTPTPQVVDGTAQDAGLNGQGVDGKWSVATGRPDRGESGVLTPAVAQ
ncbi:hypothetical protein [Streptomyces humi]